MSKVYLAADFGGGSGRVIAGWLQDGKLVMEEVHRFGNRQVRLGNHVHWDFPALFEDMKAGLKKAAAKGEVPVGAVIVRNGEICEPVKGASLIGTGSEILMQIDMVGQNMETAQGMCGSSSGSVPTDVGQPLIRVSDITVGGSK